MRRGTAALLDEHWRAQARIGTAVSAQSLAQWSRVNPRSLAESGSAWLAFMLALIRGERRRSREQSAAFLRLYRALETGYTLPPLQDDPVADFTTLGELREDWARVTDTIRTPAPDDADRIRIDGDFDWPEEPVESFDRAAVASLVTQGPAKLREQVAQAVTEVERGRLDDAGFLQELEDATTNTGITAANAADREAIRSGRDLINRASQEDKRVVGWARVTDGNPCAFCAMLAARGAIYTSQATAAGGGRRKPAGSADGRARRNRRPPVSREDLTRYHYGCHCQVVPVYSRNDFMTPDARRYDREWREVTRGKSGAEARAAWRRHIESNRS
ncbi:head maturation protease [Streptomyces phage Attoomi]|uniref:Capsid maturation protease n=1 Tax=Streptomyces phage Attoomi TaxID=2059881 RepID=A0A2H5BLE7_9CAUD|nr:head maturation protease [Streptomyces phage Attoomi]AUG87137.1 capsid maturation protease [Streptomyces phage Attoomi]